MINFFNKEKKEKKKNNKDYQIVLTCSLFIHAAKMDENYTVHEKSIIIKALSSLFKKNEDELDLIIKEAEKKESESNHILEFTREIKNYDKEFRLKIIKILWQIIYSDGHSDMYESNLMRRLSGLLYVTDKESGEIKESIIDGEKK
jgi:uncharacterized tellurite resistance protein B-like protein